MDSPLVHAASNTPCRRPSFVSLSTTRLAAEAQRLSEVSFRFVACHSGRQRKTVTYVWTISTPVMRGPFVGNGSLFHIKLPSFTSRTVGTSARRHSSI